MEEDAYVMNPLAEGFGPRLFRCPAANERVLVQRRTAAGGIRYDCVYVAREGVEIAPSERAGSRQIPRVPSQAAATALIRRCHDRDSIPRQYINRRAIDVRIENLLGASGEKSDPGSALPQGWSEDWQRLEGRKAIRE